jgi:hypothetical protein
MVESQPSKLLVASSILVSRSISSDDEIKTPHPALYRRRGYRGGICCSTIPEHSSKERDGNSLDAHRARSSSRFSKKAAAERQLPFPARHI